MFVTGKARTFSALMLFYARDIKFNGFFRMTLQEMLSEASILFLTFLYGCLATHVSRGCCESNFWRISLRTTFDISRTLMRRSSPWRLWCHIESAIRLVLRIIGNIHLRRIDIWFLVVADDGGRSTVLKVGIWVVLLRPGWQWLSVKSPRVVEPNRKMVVGGIIVVEFVFVPAGIDSSMSLSPKGKSKPSSSLLDAASDAAPIVATSSSTRSSVIVVWYILYNILLK